MSHWQQTVKTALLGTDRAELPAPPATNALGTLLAQLPPEEDAATLLAIAGVVALHQQTGWQPRQYRLPPPAFQPTDLPVCPGQLAARIDLLFEGSQTSLLPEILSALARTGHRLPDFMLPSLLEKGKKSVRLRPYILPLLGHRGRWLASQNPEWLYASPEIESWAGLVAAWDAALPAQRQALLRQLRNTKPELGRQILEHRWKTHNGMVRHQVIKILDINLTLADEPFLEAALDDRNHLVRRAAAELLAKLPASRLAQRMVQYVSGVLTWGFQKQPTIKIGFPDAITPAMIRDGIPDFKPADRARLKSRLLTQLISKVPLNHWCKTWQKSPEEIVQAALNSLWPRTLTAAFSTAAIRQQEAGWAEAIIVAQQFNTSTGRLVPLLDAHSCFSLMQQAARESTQLTRPHPLHIFLQHWPLPWSEEMAEFWINLIERHLKHEKQAAPEPTLNNLIKRFSHQCPPQMAETAVNKLSTIPNLGTAWQKTVGTFCDTLQIRHDLLTQISNINQEPESG